MKKFSTTPVSKVFGFDRGKPIDRYYIENFLNQHKSAIHGHVLEIGENAYTRKYGTAVKKSDVLDINKTKYSTIVGDLATGKNIPASTFDCIILTQVLHVIYDIRAVIENTLNALKPGGVLLLTTTGISQYCGNDTYGDYWRFTDLSLKKLLAEVDSRNEIKVNSHGNVAVAKAFLDGLALHEIPKKVLNVHDRNYQVVITAFVQKAAI
ncbi:class I SAM-dependent methyltransferase [Alkalihalobacterium alkalinitrilicum]|uniref:class I SAM-dependent methyltransferase n=1 Tax=Alkalihalobacterium alkalinitrilicum TaxID=427920 RepID=UPI000994C6C8|nr:methyltransferase domain-containing protein [Alkalihalobacterium alkalinitrilicum]